MALQIGPDHISPPSPPRKVTLTLGCSFTEGRWRFWVGVRRNKARIQSVSPDYPQLTLPIRQDFPQEAQDYAGLPPASVNENKAMANFWSSLNSDQKRVFKVKACKRVFAPGARLMREGDRGDHVAVILSGLTEIRVWEQGTERVVAERGPGQLIGERAALEMNPRSATVVAVETVVALVMRTSDFAAFIGTYPSVLKIVENQIYMRLREGARSRDGGEVAPWSAWLAGQNCTVVRTDVVAFAANERTDEDRKIIREALLTMTRVALGPVWETSRRDDRGDGLLVIVPPGVPTALVIERLVTVLSHELKRHNRIYSAPIRIRLRVAVAVGPIEEDSVGVTGKPIILAARMLDAPDFKQAIADRDAILGLIVPPFVYDNYIGRGGDLLDPAAYASVAVQVKETRTTAWMRLIDTDGTAPSTPLPLIQRNGTSPDLAA